MVTAIVVAIGADTYEVQTPPDAVLALGDTLVLQTSEDALDGARFRAFIPLVMWLGVEPMTPEMKKLEAVLMADGRARGGPPPFDELRRLIDKGMLP